VGLRVSRVVVLGGGIIGLFVARELLASGHEVTLLEGDDHAGTSAGNAGMIVPSHFVPLASPGMLRAGFRMFLRRGAPLKLGWNGSPEATRWLLTYLDHATTAHVRASAEPLVQLSLDSLRLYRTWAAQAGVAIGDQGLLMVARRQETLREEEEAAHLARAHGLDVRVVDGEELQALDPAIGPEAVGAVHFRDDAHLSPPQVLGALRREVGPHIMFARAQGWRKGDRGVNAVSTDQGVIGGDAFVVAMGARSAELLAEAGCAVPLLPGRGYGITLDPSSEAMPRVPALLMDDRVSVTPMLDGLRVTGGMEVGVWDEPVDRRRLDNLRLGFGRHYPGLRDLAWDEARVWKGWRPLSPDGLPYIGRVADNVFAATGHGMMGISLAPATGSMVAALIGGRAPSVDPLPFDPRRML